MRLSSSIVILFSLMLSLFLPTAAQARSLVVTLYPHDDLGSLGDDRLQREYVQPWLDEMRAFGRPSIEVIIQRKVPGITDIPYGTLSAEDTLQTFAQQTSAERFGHLQMLLVQHTFGTTSSGDTRLGLVRWQSPSYPLPHAIASLTTYSAMGHELGHMMGATHEAAEILYRPWPCETYVYPARVALRANCYRYSDGNRDIIAQWLQRLQASQLD